MKIKRPVNLNLLTIRFPIPAIVSILHRISGVFLFLCIPFFIWIYSASVSSEQGFNTIRHNFNLPVVKFLLWMTLSALSFHLVAGIRHLLVDLHIGEELHTGRLMSWLTMILFLVLAGVFGVWIW